MNLNNTQDYIGLVGAVYAVVSIVVRLTPTKKDDEAVSKLGRWIELLMMSRKTK